MTKTYNTAGRDARYHYSTNDDPCGYMIDVPNKFHVLINEEVGRALQRIEEVRESGGDVARASRIYNLARELASTARLNNEAGLEVLAGQIQKVVNAI